MSAPDRIIDALQSHLMAVQTYETPWGIRRDIAKRIVCADGFNMSVQVGSGMYCAPREETGPWYQVEVGYPSDRVEALMDWAEEPDKPTETVYGYVPIEVVAQVIADHGGFKP